MGNNQFIISNSNNREEQEEMLKNLANEHPILLEKINKKVIEVTEKVLQVNPIWLLRYASEQATHMSFFGIETEMETSMEDIPINRAAEYIQSILVSKGDPSQMEISENETDVYNEILFMLRDLHSMIIEYYLSWAVLPESQEIYEGMIEDILEGQLMYGVRGKRYQVFEKEYLESLLYVHNDEFTSLFGISSSDIIYGYERLIYSMSQGKADSLFEIADLIEKFNEESLDEETQNTLGDAANRAFGIVGNNVIETTGWPEPFVRELSWELGEENLFFDGARYSGWPIKDLPVFKRPFIKLDNEYYCFDYYSLVDNFYRCLQKMVTRIDQNYQWKEFQKIASENMVESVFKDILPGCTTYADNYYPIKQSLKQKAENDLIALYDSTLIILEVKAGSFVYTPPLTDFKSHIKSYKSLIEKANDQCIRTKAYLLSRESPKLYTQDNTEKSSIDMKKVKDIYTISVTMDNINTVANKAHKMSFLKAKDSTISIGIDDLMAYREYFDSPLIFLHFLKHRSIATQTNGLILDDELDHLGMYIKHNYYSREMEAYSGESIVKFIGYREPLDEYFVSLYHDDLNVEKPVNKLPKRITEIINYYETNSETNELVNYLLDFGSENKERFHKAIEHILLKQYETKNPIFFYFGGDNIRAYISVNQSDIINMEYEEKKKRVLASIFWNNESDRKLIDLFYDRNNKLKEVQWEIFSKELLTKLNEKELDEIKSMAEMIAKDRIEKYKRDKYNGKNKIGRNETCPCGRGKKYKKCCLGKF
jgi:hypothetical protein